MNITHDFISHHNHCRRTNFTCNDHSPTLDHICTTHTCYEIRKTIERAFHCYLPWLYGNSVRHLTLRNDTHHRTVRSPAVTMIVVMTMNYERLKGLLQMIVLRIVFLIVNHRKQRPQRHHRNRRKTTAVVSPQRQPRLSHHHHQQQQLWLIQSNKLNQLHLLHQHQQYQSQVLPARRSNSSSRRHNISRSHAPETHHIQRRSYSNDRYHPMRPPSSRPPRLPHLSEGTLVTKLITSRNELVSPTIITRR